jgi:hypothetical protein
MKPFLTIILFFISFIIYAQDEATQSEITIKDNIVYKNNVPYTGTLYSDESANNDCKCTLEANYLNGILNGAKKEWYYNGKQKSIKHYKNGKLVGKHIRYNIDGEIEKEELFVKGRLKETKKIISKINTLDAFSYLFKIYKPDNYSEQFLNYFLSLTDHKYHSYRNNELELRRKMINAENTIKNRINELNFKNIYKYKGYTNLGTYSFEQNQFSIKIDKINHSLTIANWNGGMISNGKTFSRKTPNIRFINKTMFESVNLSLSHSEAEILKNKAKYYLYYSLKYKIIPPIERSNSQFLTNYLDAYVLKIDFYSDRNHNDFIYSIDKSNEFNEFIANLKVKKNYANNEVKIKDKPTKTSTVVRRPRRPVTTRSQSSKRSLSVKRKSVTKKFNVDDLFLRCKKLAENGNVNSQEELGAIYYQKKDYQNALIWYTKAANANHSRAQYVLGYMYRKGIGVKKSRRTAKKWWKKSCKLGNGNACNEIKKMNEFSNALLRATGEAIIKNYKKK